MKVRLLYCHYCGWSYPGNAADLAMIPECPDCCKPSLWFIQGHDAAPIYQRAREIGLQNLGWLRTLAYRKDNAANL